MDEDGGMIYVDSLILDMVECSMDGENGDKIMNHDGLYEWIYQRIN